MIFDRGKISRAAVINILAIFDRGKFIFSIRFVSETRVVAIKLFRYLIVDLGDISEYHIRIYF